MQKLAKSRIDWTLIEAKGSGSTSGFIMQATLFEERTQGLNQTLASCLTFREAHKKAHSFLIFSWVLSQYFSKCDFPKEAAWFSLTMLHWLFTACHSLIWIYCLWVLFTSTHYSPIFLIYPLKVPFQPVQLFPHIAGLSIIARRHIYCKKNLFLMHRFWQYDSF